MKQTFTLVAAIVLSFLTANAQISQTFESTTSLAQLTGLCWQFSSGVAFSTSSQVTAANSLQVQPITNGTTTTTTTPYVSLPNASSIALNYKLSSKLATNGTRTITVKLQDYNGSITTLVSVSLDKQTPTTTQALSTSSTATTGVYKIVIEVSGSNDGNTSVYLDDLSIAGAYNYSAPYNCNSSSNGTLPVRLVSFQAILQGEQVQLNWQVTANGTGNYFEVEKSTDGRTFKTTAIVSATEKEDNEVYSLKQAFQGTSYYRLKIVNKDKSFSYSNIVFAKEQTAAANSLNLLQNPVSQSLRFTFSAETAGVADVTIYNVNGAKVYQTKLTVQKGTNSLATNLQNLNTKGTYLLEVRTAETRSVVKFTKD